MPGAIPLAASFMRTDNVSARWQRHGVRLDGGDQDDRHEEAGKMRVLVMGAGAIGCLFGEALARVGCDVTFVARRAQLTALQERGLEVRGDREPHTLRRPRVVTTPADAGLDFDLVLFTVRCYDTRSAARCLLPALDPETAVLTLQSGVDSVEEVGGVVGRERMLLGTALVDARIDSPGVIVLNAPTRLVTVGEPSGGVTERVERVVSALEEAGFAVTLGTAPTVAIWEQLAVFAPHATLTSACQLTLGEISEATEGVALYRQLIAEVVAVARAAEVELAADAEARALSLLMSYGPEASSSMARDFAARRRVELEQVTGAVVRRGHELRVPTPGFDALYCVLKARALAFGGLTSGSTRVADGRAPSVGWSRRQQPPPTTRTPTTRTPTTRTPTTRRGG